MEKTIGNYIIKKKIGTGSYADVLLGVHSTINQVVAIKNINCKKIKIKKNFKACEREIRIYQNFDHPNIVKVFDILNKDALLCIVMEYAEKGDLLSVIQNSGKLTEKETRYYFRQIIAGLEYSHLYGYSHRDLKLENILLTEKNIIKITDFGLADQLKNGRFFKTCCGTIRYADPEILREKPYSGELCDVWSCGVVLFTLMCGYLPFDDDVFGIILKKMMISEYSIPSDISNDAKDLITNILKPEINKRMTLQEIKCHKWFVFEDLSKQIFFNFTETDYKKILIHKIDFRLIKKLRDLYFENSSISEKELIYFIIKEKNGTDKEKSEDCFFTESNFKKIQLDKIEEIIDLVKVKANCDFNCFEENIDIKQKQRSNFIVDYFILSYFEKQKKSAEKAVNKDDKFFNYLFSEFDKVLDNEKNLEFFTETFHFFNIILNKTSKMNWTFGIQTKLGLNDIIKKFSKLFNVLKIKIEVEKSEEYFFKCYLVDDYNNKTNRYFELNIYDNFDEFTIDLKNHNLNNFKFVNVVHKVITKFKS